jgi:DNA-directed RNA polymerase I subunit RPA1
LAGVSFSFYTYEEVKKLSVQQILEPVAFDQLNNPVKQGLHDKKLGVSPFDHKSKCPTCGMTVNYCPGHVGHIDLTVPIYNPFLFKETYKLLKAKCFSCHRMRIHPHKIEAFIGALKLMKTGDVVHSKELKRYLLYAAKAITLFPANALGDQKKMKAFKASIENESQGKVKLNIESADLPNFITKLENAINEKKENFEQHLKDIFKDVIDGNVELVNTSTSQRALLDLFKEIWGSVVTTTCPHCKHKSPAVKKDGFTKLFIKPLQGQAAVTARQSRNIQAAGSSRGGSKSRDSSAGAEGFEVITNASTSNSRRLSASATAEMDESVID